jgi:UDP-N-acetylglucosamine 4,6-dehydratase/UDP-glucose 4-epimerase
MQTEFDDPRLRFLIGDVRDQVRLSRAVEDVDIVFHAAALKHVPLIEYNPYESVMTNVIGSQNVITECIKNHVEKVIGIGTDKSVSPLNTYGATKLLMEKLFIGSIRQFNANKYKTKTICLRYGNVVASSGSVIPLFINQIKNKQKITITDPNMTRFSLTMDEAIKFILSSAEKSVGTEVFVPKMRAYNIMDLKDTLIELFGDAQHEIIQSRPGEKLHELLLSKYELPTTRDLNDRYAILYPQLSDLPENLQNEIKANYKEFSPAELSGEYSSDNVKLLSKDELKEILISSGIDKID